MSSESFNFEARAVNHESFRSPAADRLSEQATRAFEIERILCPIDFSETSRTALGYAVALAKWHDAEIRAIHVVDVPPIAGPEAPTMNDIRAMSDEARAEAKHRLRGFLEPAESAGVRTMLEIRAGDTVEQIVDLAAASDTDVIVIGTRGIGGVKRFVLGSTADKLVRVAPCPILTVPPHADPVPTWRHAPFTRILCPVSFSEPSLVAVELALSLAQEANGDVTLFHAVVQVGPVAGVEHVGLTEPLDDHRHDLERDAIDRLRRLIPDDVRAWCRPEAVVVADLPVRAILDFAQRAGSDLIVMSLHPRGGFERWLLGSTTQSVAREAVCPVLTAR
jgi:nucleotide-binding universal stress UspA family protein